MPMESLPYSFDGYQEVINCASGGVAYVEERYDHEVNTVHIIMGVQEDTIGSCREIEINEIQAQLLSAALASVNTTP